MLNRRDFIKTTIASATATMLLPQQVLGINENKKLQNIGYISGMLKNHVNKRNWKRVLKKTVKYGYTEYEGGIQGESATEFKNYCEEIGLRYIAGGIKFTEEMDRIKERLDEIKSLGMSYAVCYWPWFSGGPFKLEDCKKSAPLLNKIGELANQRDLNFCWHNHDKEFKEMEKGTPFEYLMKNTDENQVYLEMDIYWVKKGGANPLEILKKYEGRTKIFHVKDMADDDAQSIRCPGKGIINFVPIFAEGYRQGIEHYFVERDKVVDGLDCLKSSADFLKNTDF